MVESVEEALEGIKDGDKLLVGGKFVYMTTRLVLLFYLSVLSFILTDGALEKTCL